MTTQRTLRLMTRYSAWANQPVFQAAMKLLAQELTRPRPGPFENIVHTLNHVYGLHVVNHSTYHRGFVADHFNQIPSRPPTTDLPVFLRDARPALV
jgi:uncharacterized damage-inducible protein DinB